MNSSEAKRNHLTSRWNYFYSPTVTLRPYSAPFRSDLSNFPYLIMAASEREERGGAICYRGLKDFNLGIRTLHRGTRTIFILYSGYPHWSSEGDFFSQSAQSGISRTKGMGLRFVERECCAMTPNTPAKEIKHAGYFFSNTLRKSTDKGTGKRSFISTLLRCGWCSLTCYVMYVIYIK